jgi:hypothetical protein
MVLLGMGYYLKKHAQSGTYYCMLYSDKTTVRMCRKSNQKYSQSIHQSNKRKNANPRFTKKTSQF